MSEMTYNLPADREDFKGEFIVFFSEETNPPILFHSIIAEEAYKKAEEIFKEKAVRPTVIQVQEVDDNVAQILAFQ
jgi:hypothetical protein